MRWSPPTAIQRPLSVVYQVTTRTLAVEAPARASDVATEALRTYLAGTVR